VCQRLRKNFAANNATPSSAITSMPHSKSPVARGGYVKDALVELMERVNAMDCNEAYKQMCLAQDEIRRLQSEIQDPSQESQEKVPQQEMSILTETRTGVKMKDSSEMKAASSSFSYRGAISTQVNGNSKSDIFRNTADSAQLKKSSEKHMTLSGSWLNQGGNCSIEYLPNVKCYSITLVATEGDSLTTPQSKDSLHFTIAPAKDVRFETITHFEVKLYQITDTSSSSAVIDQRRNLDVILSASLKTTTPKSATNPSGRISLDSNSISLRIQLQHEITTMAMDGMDLMDNLLGVEGSSFSSFTTNVSELNYIRCRKCQHPLVDPPLTNVDASCPNEHSAVIQSVLPLPSGYWDDISDYLICYEGQAAVDFTSSSTTAIPGTVLEDDTILVLHQHDLAEGGFRTLGVKRYGEHSSDHLNNNGNGSSSSKAWKGKSATKGAGSKSVTCASCCSALGFVADNNSDTFWLYKHLLSCGNPCSREGASIFLKYTCGSFLAKEMVRYAESEAIYTFIVGISDENDWTRAHNPGECILLRVLSWDTPLAVAGGSRTYSSEDPGVHKIHFQRVVKVIFEVISDKKELTAVNDDPLEWRWRDIDFCCPPTMRHAESNDASSNIDGNSSATLSTKASSTRIFFSKPEWYELRNTLMNGSHYFSDAMKDAIVLAKLGVPGSDQEQTASLSFLPIA